MVQVALTSMLPSGIRLRKGKKFDSLILQTRKNVVDADGKQHQIADTRTVKFSVANPATDKEYTEAFKFALEEAKKEKLLAIQHIAVHGVESTKAPKQRSVGTIGEVFDLVYKSRWENSSQQKTVDIYAKDLFAFFPKTITMEELHQRVNYDNFIKFMEKRITERKMNNRGTYNNSSTNRRFILVRVCTAYAIEYGLMHKDKVMNTDPREVANYGWKNLKVKAIKKKNVLNKEEENNMIEEMKKRGDHEFADEFAWNVDVGMRYETEMLTFTIKDINWKKKTICFWREKTKEWSENIPLSKRAWSIATRYKDVALSKTSQRMFGHSKHKIEALFKKYRDIFSVADFTPYVTRRMFGTRLAERGVNPKIIARMMGHACTETAQKYYIQTTDKGMERAVKLTEISDEQFDSYLDNQNSNYGHNSKGLI